MRASLAAHPLLNGADLIIIVPRIQAKTGCESVLRMS
jgi:hypothetical protein